MVEAGTDAGEIAHAVTVTVAEGAGVHLVDDAAERGSCLAAVRHGLTSTSSKRMPAASSRRW